LDDFGAKSIIDNLCLSFPTNLLSRICEAIFEDKVVLPEPLDPLINIIFAFKIFCSDGKTSFFAKQ
jgi:hypothetical protein